MTRHHLTFVTCVALALAAAAGLGAQAFRSFEVASVRPSPEQAPGQAEIGLRITNQQVRLVHLPLSEYIAMAHEVRRGRVIGPDWLGQTRFDIAATLPAGATRKELPALMRTLLEERFRLKAHKEQREFPVYALEVASGGLKLTPSKVDPDAQPQNSITVTGAGSNRGVAIDLGGGSSYSFAAGKFEGKRLTPAMIADALNNFVDRPIVDMTNVTGQFDMSFEVTPEDYQSMLIRAAVANGVVLPPQALRALENGSIASLVDALRAAGLSLQSRRAPLEVLVVDSADRTPTAN